MNTITINTYTFRELSKEAQKRVLDTMRYINVEYSDWDSLIIADWKEALERDGFMEPCILYTGFWSQGHGACFTARLDIADYLRTRKLTSKFPLLAKYADHCMYRLRHNCRYYFATSTNSEYEAPCLNSSAYNRDTLLKEFDGLDAIVLVEREKTGNEIYKQLEQEYRYQTSDKVIINSITENGDRFLKDGRITPTTA